MARLEIVDYRRRVAEIYARVRDENIPINVRWERFVENRNDLFAHHSQSALSDEQRKIFRGLDYFPYDPTLRYTANLDRDVKSGVIKFELANDGLIQIERIAKVRFQVEDQSVALTLFWIMGYGGGVFLPFRDATNGHETYGGGRYLLDSIKHADLGTLNDKIVLDFNFAYNPSCAYHPRWDCPLAPAENWVSVPVCAGEKSLQSEPSHPGLASR